MTLLRSLSIAALTLGSLSACGDDSSAAGDDGGLSDAGASDASAIDSGGEPPDDDDGGGGDEDAGGDEGKTVLDLADVAAHPDDYAWFDFRPNLKKLILAGAAETEHVAILWYTVEDGGVALHYHSKTESVYVIDGTQTDAKGTYETGTVYFNPPTSGHQITDSSGFFLLAYASPPDFMGTDMIEPYTPITLDTEDPDFTSEHPFDEQETGVLTFAPELDAAGGMSAEFIETTSAAAYEYTGTYVLVLDGSCEIDGDTYAEDMLVASKTVVPEPFTIAASASSTCLVMAVSF